MLLMIFDFFSTKISTNVLKLIIPYIKNQTTIAGAYQ